MTHQFDVKPNRRSGSVLGATLILFLGSIAVGVIFGFLGGDTESGMVIFGCGIAVILLFLGLSFTRPVSMLSEAVSWMLIRHRQEELDYEPGPKAKPQQRYGTNAPTTPDEVRELKAGGNNWVPAAGRNGRTSPRRRD